MTGAVVESVQPDREDIAAADVAVAQVKSYLRAHPEGPGTVLVRVGGGDEQLVLPRPAVELFAQILAFMAAGQGVSVVPSNAELTTQQAADLLNVSRPYLIGLLAAGEIDYRKVGRHRRIAVSSLLAYLRADDQRRNAAADELTVLGQEMGLI